MDEIRFRQSEDEVEAWLENAKKSPFRANDRCDKCGHWRTGFYDISHRTFICLSCRAVEMFIEKVGKPDSF